MPDQAEELATLRAELAAARRQAAEAQEALSQILDSSPIAIFLGNTRGYVVTEASANISRILGYSAEELIDSPWIDLIHPDDRDDIAATVARLVRDDTVEWTGRARHADGRWRWIHVHVSAGPPAPDGSREVMGYIQDRTNEARAEERYRTISEITSDFAYVFHVTADGGVEPEWASGAHEDITGYTLEEGATWGSWQPIVHPDDQEMFLQSIVDVIKGETQSGEMRIIHKSGEVRWVRLAARPGFDSSGRVDRVYGAATDITERKLAELALAESERALREAQDVGRIGSFRANLVEGSIEWSDATYRILGYEPGEVTPTVEWLFEAVHLDDRDPLVEALRKGIETRHATDHEARFRRRDGDMHWFHFRGQPEYGQDGTPVAFQGIVQDVTERKRAEQALAESEERFRRVVEQSPLGLATFDADGHLVMWSPAAERMLGWTADQVLGQAVASLDRNEIEEFKVLFDRVLEGASITDHETVALRADGSEIHATVSMAPLTDSQGEIIGVLTLFADISERKRLEDQLLQAQKMSALGRLAGGVAHDFNNLLTAILGHAEFLSDDADDPAEVREHAKGILAACQRAAGFTEQMLAFSRHRAPDAVVLDVNGVVGDLEEVLDRIVGPDVRMEVSLAPPPAWVRIARPQLEQVVLNLVVNARDAMADGGKVRVETLVAGGEVWLSVQDSGPGVDAEVRPRIFEPFFTTKESGTGLGLSVVYGVVEAAGGRVVVESPPGSGARFTVCLPLCAAPEAAATATRARALSLAGIESVLLVEDESPVRALVARALRQWGYTVVDAPDGETALDIAAARGEPFDALVTDMVMPGIGGVELSERLRARWPGLKVLYVSGYSESAPEHDQPVSYLRKPFTPPELVEALRRTLDGTVVG